MKRFILTAALTVSLGCVSHSAHATGSLGSLTQGGISVPILSGNSGNSTLSGNTAQVPVLTNPNIGVSPTISPTTTLSPQINPNINANVRANVNPTLNTNVNPNVNTSVLNRNSTSNTNTSRNTNKNSNQSSANNSVNTNSTTNNNIDMPVSTAYAPPLTASNDTCMGSSSLGGQAAGFGLTLGTTWDDGDCVRRKDARFLHNAGRPELALAVMCQSEQVRRAIALAGTPQEKALCNINREDVTEAQAYKPSSYHRGNSEPRYNQ